MSDSTQNDLKDKVGSLPTQISEDQLADIDNAIQGLSDEFLVAIEEQINQMLPLFDKVRKGENELHDLFVVAHDIKGQAGTFGYPLITFVGNELCRFIEKIKEPYTDEMFEVVLAHISTMSALFKNKVTGEGGETEHKILDGLEEITQKVLKTIETA